MTDTWRTMPKETPGDVLKLIEAFCEQWPDANHSFAHIALDDYNLADGNIGYCLDYRQEWFECELKSLDPKYSKKDSPYDWERFLYDELVKLRDAISEFLEYLLTIPEEIREGVLEISLL